uniref:Uncharacterized protein n=1 Tax=Romanomermis culicivorax TaxID=13658 RepID=A0A915K6Q8_ROMCU
MTNTRMIGILTLT